MRDLLAGLAYAWRGLRLVLQPGLRRFVAVPLALNTALFAGAIWYVLARVDALVSRWIPDWLSWIEWLLWPLLAVAAALLVFYTFSLAANLLGAPFNGWLAEAVERRVTGQGPPAFSVREMLRQTPRLVGAEARKLGWFLARAVPLGLLFLVPGLNLLAPFLWLAFSAWALALEYLDYPMGNHALLFPEVRARARRRRLLALGFGLGVTALTTVPVLNFLAMPAGVAGATLLWAERLRGATARSGSRTLEP